MIGDPRVELLECAAWHESLIEDLEFCAADKSPGFRDYLLQVKRHKRWVGLIREMANRIEKRASETNSAGCVICGIKAVTTAANIPVCQKHWDEYAAEASKYPIHRPVFTAMQSAWKLKTDK